MPFAIRAFIIRTGLALVVASSTLTASIENWLITLAMCRRFRDIVII